MAIVDNVALYALGYWAHESHPVRIDQYCLNTVQRKTPCDACSQACPQHIAIDGKQIDWHGCTNCNLCISACPTQAIHESSASFDAFAALMDAPGDTAVLSCGRYDGRADLKVSCLAALPWELVAALALKKRVVLKVSPCKQCPDAGLYERVGELFSELKRFFGRDGFKERILPREPSDARADRGAGAAKRTALEGAMSTVRRGAANLVEEAPNVSHYRALLLDALESMPEAERPAVAWLTLIEDGACRGCEICSRMCPHHAIELRVPEHDEWERRRAEEKAAKKAKMAAGRPWERKASAEAQEDAAAQADRSASAEASAAEGPDADAFEPLYHQELIHDASRCTRCGLCYVSCPEQNLGGWDEVTTSRLPALVEHEIHVEVCEKCGRAFKPAEEGQTKCPACNRMRFSR